MCSTVYSVLATTSTYNTACQKRKLLYRFFPLLKKGQKHAARSRWISRMANIFFSLGLLKLTRCDLIEFLLYSRRRYSGRHHRFYRLCRPFYVVDVLHVNYPRSRKTGIDRVAHATR